MKSNQAYFDHNATTPIAPQVKEKLVEWAELWGNPSSIHQHGRGPKTLIREARKEFALWVGAHPLELIFTGGGSESNSSALQGLLRGVRRLSPENLKKRNEVMVSSVEHPSLRKTALFLEREGFQLKWIPVNREGQLDEDWYIKNLSEKTFLVSTMMANNETGHIFPIQKMAAAAHGVGAYFHTDAVQALGKIPFELRELGVDLASFSAHKVYALKGLGVLYVKKGTPFDPLILGGGQERGRRGGTENTLGIAALGEMARFFKAETPELLRKSRELRDYLESEVLKRVPGVKVIGPEGERLPNTSSLLVDGVDGEILLMNLDMSGFSVSTGAACSSGSPEPSPVLLGMGFTPEEAQASLRIGLGIGNSSDEVDRFIDEFERIVLRIRSFSNPDEVNP